jgi:hypothetical protein
VGPASPRTGDRVGGRFGAILAILLLPALTGPASSTGSAAGASKPVAPTLVADQLDDEDPDDPDDPDPPDQPSPPSPPAEDPAPPAGPPPAAQGIQFGQPIDFEHCTRNGPPKRFLANASLLARTKWLRMDFRGAGVTKIGTCDLRKQYRALVDDIVEEAPHIQFIGLFTEEFVWGSGLTVSPQVFADAAGVLACDPKLSEVGVWEVWNEPTKPETALSADRYAEVLGLTARKVRDCGDKVISGGITIDPIDPLAYLNAVDVAIQVNSHGGFLNLIQAVDGIGVHPYVGIVAEGESGHEPMEEFLVRFLSHFTKPLYITEFGWPIRADLDEQTQCRNLVNAFAEIHSRWAPHLVPAATWFTLEDFGDPTANLGLYDGAQVPRPALTGYLRGTCPPRTPTEVGASVREGGVIRVTWTDNSTNETSFQVSNGSTTKSVSADVNRLTWRDLAPGSTTCFQVRSVNANGPSPWSVPGCAMIPKLPKKPSKPKAVAVDTASIRVTWKDESNNEDGFEIFNGVEYRNVGAGVTSLVWDGLYPGQYMCFLIRAFNITGYSPPTAYACTYTLAPPSTPSGVAAAGASSGSIRVTWSDTATETGYEVSNGIRTVDVASNRTSYTWGGLGRGELECFRIRAYNEIGSSDWSDWACGYAETIPAQPTGLTVVAVNSTAFRLTWVDRSSNEDGFVIYDGGGGFVTLDPNATSVLWTGFSSGTYRCFTIKSFNVVGESAWTDYECATTP